MKKKISGELVNLLGLGVDFHKDLSKRQEKSSRKKRVKEIIENRKKSCDGKELDAHDLYCIVCGAEVDLETLSCRGCGMEFNMNEKEARHMISLMIGIFWADGILDENEQTCLAEYIEKIDVSPRTKTRLKKEVNSPRKLKNIIRWIKSPQAKRNTLRMAIASGMVSKWNDTELLYLEDAKKLLNLKPEQADKVIKDVEEYLQPLMA